MKYLLSFVICVMLGWGGYMIYQHKDKFAANQLIPRQLLFGNPEVMQVRISPDGQYLSYIKPIDGVRNLWVRHLATGKEKAVTHSKKQPISRHGWAYDNKHLLYIQDQEGDENWNLFKANVETGNEMPLTQFNNVQVRLEAVSYKHPEEIIIGVNDRKPEWHDLYRMDLVTGEKEKIFENDRFAGFLLDDDYTVRLAYETTPEGGYIMYKPGLHGTWHEFIKVPFEDSEGVAPIAFDQEKNQFYMLDTRNTNTKSFVAVDYDTGKVTSLANDPQADISDVLFVPKTSQPIAVMSTYLRTRVQVLDPAFKTAIDFLIKHVEGKDFKVVSQTLANDQWIVARFSDTSAIHYYLYDLPKQQLTFLVSAQPALDKAPLVPMHALEIPTRDGLKLVSYLTLPQEVALDDRVAKTTRPVPLILYVHGGPWARDTWGYDGVHQWLANRGYAVLSVNYRGSTGLGKSFLMSSIGEWGKKMHDDLLDAVQWAVDQKITTSDKVGILGGSYGGYAVLAGLTMTPDVFACGVDIVGPSNLNTLIASIPPYWKPLRAQMTRLIGASPDTAKGRAYLKSRSPLTYVETINKPLLIAQGKNDPRVTQAESDQIVDVMTKKGIPVTYALFPDEGHGFQRPENSIAFWAIAEQFLHQHLGGFFEAIGDDYKGSTATVLAGEIEGLPKK